MAPQLTSLHMWSPATVIQLQVPQPYGNCGLEAERHLNTGTQVDALGCSTCCPISPSSTDPALHSMGTTGMHAYAAAMQQDPLLISQATSLDPKA